MIEAVHQDRPLALVVAMASDKDHLSIAKQLLSGTISSLNLTSGIILFLKKRPKKEEWYSSIESMSFMTLENNNNIICTLGTFQYKKYLICPSEVQTISHVPLFS